MKKANSGSQPVHDSEQQAAMCADVEAEIMGLKANYEQYFLGMERQPPLKRHDALKKQVNALKNAFVRQTALKFRIQSVAQKFVTYERLWVKTLQEIENGTYKRDLFKLKLKKPDAPAKAKVQDKAGDFDVDEDLDISDIDGDLESALEAAAAALEKKHTPPAKAPTEEVAAVAPAAYTSSASSVVKPPPAARPLSSIPPPPAISLKPASGAVAAVSPAVPPLSTIPPPPPGPTSRPLSGPIPAMRPVSSTAPTVPGGIAAARPPSGGIPAARPVSSPGMPSRAPATASSPDGLSDQKIRAIYDAYVSAKKRCGEDTSNLSIKGVTETLKKQVPELMKQHNAKSVEFKVVIKEGKAVLRALPKD